jgi:formylglycine-generating enzyme required for sulfatase activity
MYAENMAGSYGYDTTKIGTNLTTGAEWDTVMKWVQNSSKNITNSTTWGNYNNSTTPANIFGFSALQVSGYSDVWKAKNIYDLAGNMWELTNEKYSANFVMRGGPFNNTGSTYSSAYRTSTGATSTLVNLGFRVALYIK